MADFIGPFEDISSPAICNGYDTYVPDDFVSHVLKGPGYSWDTASGLVSFDCDNYAGIKILKQINYIYQNRADLRNDDYPIPINAVYPYLSISKISSEPAFLSYHYASGNESILIATLSHYQNSYLKWYDARGMWFVSKSYYIVPEEDFIDPCPPGTTFNPNTGTCDVLPEYKWDGSEYILKVPGDIDYIPPQLCDGQTITYTLRYNGVDTIETCEAETKIFYISYAGSTLTNGVDFDGPTSITFTESGSKDFDIVIFDYAETTSGKIIINIEDPYGECPNYIEIFDIEDCSPNEPSIETSCCNYVPKDFIEWSNFGYGVPDIEKPTGIRN